ncbi:MAG: WhiB family transcriptional regulator [Actinomycetia bacterium]|nr:WhiB family transcriptional regulator [Actinomycetes bacterium]
MGHPFADPTSEEVNGLCAYSDPEDWFDYRKAEEAKRICSNCPLRQACARAALDNGDIYGIWAGVDLGSGIHSSAAERAAAQRQLRFVAAAMDDQPDSHRQRTQAIRSAVHAAAFPAHSRHSTAEPVSA